MPERYHTIMLNIAFSGLSQTFDVPLRTMDGVAPAIQGVASWTLLKADMSPVAGVGATIETEEGDTLLSIEVPEEGHIKAGDVEARFLQVSWTSNGKPRRTHFGYVVIDWAPIMTTADAVRDFLGAHPSEIPDSSIDIWAAWLNIRTKIGAQTALDRLMDTSGAAMTLNKAIACRTAIEVAMWMKTRLASKMSSETLSFQRYGDLDIDKLIRDLGATEQDLLYPGVDEASREPALFFTLSSTRADAVTGA